MGGSRDSAVIGNHLPTNAKSNRENDHECS